MQINKRLFCGILSIALSSNFSCVSFAADLSKDILSVITNSSVNKECVSVCIKTLDNKQKTIYELNSRAQNHPASIQKIITTLPAIKTLGEDYNFETKLYKNSQGDFIILLGADPYLQSKDLKALTRNMPSEVKSISIDDSILDKDEWGEGWQWDDDLNPCMPKFSSYNIDRNTLKFYIEPTEEDCAAKIITDKEYPINIINDVITAKNTGYSIKRKSYESPDVVFVSGMVSKTVTASVPVNSPKKNFKLRLTDALLDNSKSNNGIYNSKKLTDDYILQTKISHSIIPAKKDILKNSDNFISETVFKLAGGKYTNSVGTFENGKLMLKNYCENNGLDFSQINIVDASGVSKNNLMTADFMTKFLVINKDELETMLATSGEGTLADRLLYLRNNLRAKTGTLNGVSALAGYVSSQNGHKYAFTIIISDGKSSNNNKKLLEDNIIKTLYLKG